MMKHGSIYTRKIMGGIYQLCQKSYDEPYYSEYNVKPGDYLKLIYDNGTHSPQFKSLINNSVFYVDMRDVKLVHNFTWIKIRSNDT